MRYPCNKCEYAATSPSYLRIHIESEHKEVKYLFDKCEYVATTPSYLRNHIESKHEGVINVITLQLHQVLLKFILKVNMKE